MINREVKVNGIYRHFKGHVYRVIGVGKDADNLEEKVVYQNVDNDEIWIRNKEEFLSLVDKKKYSKVKQKHRFELVE